MEPAPDNYRHNYITINHIKYKLGQFWQNLVQKANVFLLMIANLELNNKGNFGEYDKSQSKKFGAIQIFGFYCHNIRVFLLLLASFLLLIFFWYKFSFLYCSFYSYDSSNLGDSDSSQS